MISAIFKWLSLTQKLFRGLLQTKLLSSASINRWRTRNTFQNCFQWNSWVRIRNWKIKLKNNLLQSKREDHLTKKTRSNKTRPMSMRITLLMLTLTLSHNQTIPTPGQNLISSSMISTQCHISPPYTLALKRLRWTWPSTPPLLSPWSTLISAKGATPAWRASNIRSRTRSGGSAKNELTLRLINKMLMVYLCTTIYGWI